MNVTNSQLVPMGGASDSALVHHERRLALAIKKAESSGNVVRLHSANREYLRSFACRYVAARDELPELQARKLARQIDPWRACSEPVRVSPRFKANGDVRFIYSYGQENRVRQTLLRNLLLARWKIAPAQTMFSGGREEAIRRIKLAYSKGYQFVLELDVAKCYRSFDKEKLHTFFALPKAVTDHVLSGSSQRIIPSSYTVGNIATFFQSESNAPTSFLDCLADDWDAAHPGLIEGSRCSPYAAESLLAPVCQACLSSGVGQVINYADNFLLAARTEIELSELSSVLREALHSHPVGPLKVKEQTDCLAESAIQAAHKQPFDFLGYRLTPVRSRLVVTWALKNEEKARAMREEASAKLNSSTVSRTDKQNILRELVEKHRALVAAFPAWTGGARYHIAMMEELLRLVDAPLL